MSSLMSNQDSEKKSSNPDFGIPSDKTEILEDTV